MSRSDDDRLAELCARHSLGEYGGGVARRLDELFSMPAGDVDDASAKLLNACEHLGVTGEQLKEVVARLPEVKA